MVKEIRTEIVINGNVENVWKNLMDFDSFSEWNPFIQEIKVLDNELKIGSKLKAKIAGTPIKPTVTKLEENKKFAWLGKLFLPRVFDGHHQFYLQELDENQIKLVHKEEFRGILVRPIIRLIGKKTKSGFEQMNQALKMRVEAS